MLRLGGEALRRTSRTRVGPIGVDFESNRIHLVQLERSPMGTALRAASSMRLPADETALEAEPRALRRILNAGFRGHRFKGRHVVTHAPPTDLRLMVLNYNLEQGRSEPAQIMDLARERMRDELTEHVVDFVPIRTSGDKTGERSALVAVAPEGPVIQHLERLERAGLRVDAIEIAPVAIRRLFTHISGQGANEITLVLRLRREGSELTLLSGQRLLLYRQIEVGLDDVVMEVARALDADEETAAALLTSYGVDGPKPDDLARVADPTSPSSDTPFAEVDPDETEGIVSTLRDTIRPSLRGIVEQAHKAVSYATFQTRGMSIEKVYLLEGAQACPGLDGLLAEMLELPVQCFEPSDALDAMAPAGRQPLGQRYALALGFALRGLCDG